MFDETFQLKCVSVAAGEPRQDKEPADHERPDDKAENDRYSIRNFRAAVLTNQLVPV